MQDKKIRGGNITLVVPARIGKCRLKMISVNKLEQFISYGLYAEVSGFAGSRFLVLRVRFPARFSAATAVYTCLLQKNFGQKTPDWQDLSINRKFTTIRQQIRVGLQLCSQQLDEIPHVLPAFYGHIPGKPSKIVMPER